MRIVPDGEAARLSGARVGNNLSTDTIWGPTLQKLESRMAFWANRDRYPDLRVRKMIADWLPAGMTQFLTMCQGVPEQTIIRVTKLQQAFVWRGSRQPPVNIETLERSKHEGGLGLINLHERIKAIQVMRIKCRLESDEQPRWSHFAAAIIANDVTIEEGHKSDEQLRWNPFTQAWAPLQMDAPLKKGPSELKELMQTARDLKVSLRVLFPAQSLRRALPAWDHVALQPLSQQTRTLIRNTTKFERSKCLIVNLHIKTVADAERAAKSRNFPLKTTNISKAMTAHANRASENTISAPTRVHATRLSG